MTVEGDASRDSRPRRDLAGLDGLRAVAVGLVILFHSADEFAPGGGLRLVASHGVFGVPIFFVLSGFLITFLLLREESSRGRVDLPKFYARRSIRILPPAYVFMIAMMVLSVLGLQPMSRRALVSSLLFFRNYAMQPPWISGHLWSLAVEEHFYLVWPVFFVLVRNPRARLVVALVAVAWCPFWKHHSAPHLRIQARELGPERSPVRCNLDGLHLRPGHADRPPRTVPRLEGDDERLGGAGGRRGDRRELRPGGAVLAGPARPDADPAVRLPGPAHQSDDAVAPEFPGPTVRPAADRPDGPDVVQPLSVAAAVLHPGMARVPFAVAEVAAEPGADRGDGVAELSPGGEAPDAAAVAIPAGLIEFDSSRLRGELRLKNRGGGIMLVAGLVSCDRDTTGNGLRPLGER